MIGSSGDVFSEVIVKRKLTTGNYVVRVLCAIVTLVLLALFILGFFAALPGLFIFAIIILVIEYFVIKFQKVEYEYIFTSGELDFESMEVLAPEGSHYLDGYNHTDGIKVYDFSTRDKSKKRYVYVGANGSQGRIKVIFEPSEKMLDNMYHFSPSKVKVND